ncbi:hypothetical protein F5884DRAFT_525165 [Xylogone sp. PMI_703]|nr:hypothetical protein F5884DRAFT_525165 [Xylogone sp. PMI_703]
MTAVTLMGYLQLGLPGLTVIDLGQSRSNTVNDRYGHGDITHIGVWQDFNLRTITTSYGAVLKNTAIAPEPMPTTPPQPITSEVSVWQRVSLYLDSRVRRALNAGFHYMRTQNRLRGHSVISTGEGELAQIPGGFRPGRAFFVGNLRVARRVNRVPGDLKPSYKWSSALRNTRMQQMEYKPALSQVNWYMRQHSTRYGFILTDRELVAIRRLDNNGRLELSEPIPWTTRGTSQQPQLTVLLALWYLGMLASENPGWRLPGGLPADLSARH